MSRQGYHGARFAVYRTRKNSNDCEIRRNSGESVEKYTGSSSEKSQNDCAISKHFAAVQHPVSLLGTSSTDLFKGTLLHKRITRDGVQYAVTMPESHMPDLSYHILIDSVFLNQK